jgi:hypothetical protein
VPIALVLVVALALGLIGAWGTARLLGRLHLSSSERFVLTLGIFPSMLGEAAFVGLLVGYPGPLLPSVLCLVLGSIAVILSVRRVSHVAVSTCEICRSAREPASLRMTEGAGDAAPVAVGVTLFAAGALGTTLLTPLSGGALRIGDWVAHWFLVLVYLGQPLPDLRTFVNRVGDFGVISRPPLYNLEGGLLVGSLGIQFWPFQLITPLLALSVAGAAVLWGRAVGGGWAARVIAGLAGLSPFLLQNARYPWSKMVTAGLVLLFLLLIRAAALARCPKRARQAFVLAALCAGLGSLGHHSALLYVGPALLWLIWRRPSPLFRRSLGWTLGTWALGGLAGFVSVAPWLGWVLTTHGLRGTLEANPALFGAVPTETPVDWLLKGAVVAFWTLVPPLLGGGSSPVIDQLLRIQLGLLTGGLGLSGCWLLLRAARRHVATLKPGPPPTGERAHFRNLLTASGPRAVRWLRRPSCLGLAVAGGFFSAVLLQTDWHVVGVAGESMTPIVVLGLAYVARETVRLGPAARRLFFALVLAELAIYLGLWLWWAFGVAWTRDPNAVLASRYGLDHIRGLWRPAVPLGALLLSVGLIGSAVLLWRSLRLGRQPVERR